MSSPLPRALSTPVAPTASSPLHGLDSSPLHPIPTQEEPSEPHTTPRAEFIALIALTTSLVALSIDAMLPALGLIADELHAPRANDRQLILSFFFLGLSCGQVGAGPLSDSWGRKATFYRGMGLFLLGALLCAFTESFTWLLIGRFIQGVGAAAPRVVSVAIVRDQYRGRAMASVMSFVSSVFILVPILAPTVGQLMLQWFNWRAIFWLFLGIGLVNAVWFHLRQPETLPPARRAPFAFRRILRDFREAGLHPITGGYTIAGGCVFSCMFVYLSTSQQLLQEQYQLGEWFPAVFGFIALSLGIASFTNGKLVMRYGMDVLARLALIANLSLALLAWLVSSFYQGLPPLFFFVSYLSVTFFFQGLLFGNLNAKAMEPMGHIAGSAAALTGSLSNGLALLLGTFIGRSYQGNIYPLVFSFGCMAALSLLITEWAKQRAKQHPPALSS